MSEPSPLVLVAKMQAQFCAAQGSPFSAQLLERIGADIEAGGPISPLFAQWAGLSVRALFDEAVVLRLLGGLHYLVLSGQDPDLAAVYPGASDPARTDLGRALEAAVERHRPFLADFMRSPPQTNEVRRCVCLLGGFLIVAQRFGLPLRCLEIGASAGLNQFWDKYRYELGGLGAWGEADSPVRLDTEWSGPAPPLETGVRVAERAACDVNPFDLADPDQRCRLEAYVWPDQADRLARLRAAIALARAAGVRVERADAAAWAKARATPRPGVATVFYHSVMWSYLQPQTRAEIESVLARAAAQASPEAPFAWLRMEPNPETTSAVMEIRLSLWPGGEDVLLAEVHPHGARVNWLAN